MSTNDTPNDWKHGLLQYGALGAIVLVIILVGVYLLHTFVPIWKENSISMNKARIAHIEKASTSTAEIAETMKAMRFEMNKGFEQLASKQSLSSARRRQ